MLVGAWRIRPSKEHHPPMRDVLLVVRCFVTAFALLASYKPAKDARPVESKSAAPVPAAVTPGDLRCPATGQWAECSVLYRLDRSGLAPHIDSTGTASEKALSGR